MSCVSSPLDLRYIDGTHWELLNTFTCESDIAGTITVEPPFRTDFNSIPRGLWNILPPDDYGEAAVLHDYLYQVAVLHGQDVSRLLADQVHREFVRFRHAPAWKERAMFYALRACGWVPWNRYRRAA